MVHKKMPMRAKNAGSVQEKASKDLSDKPLLGIYIPEFGMMFAGHVFNETRLLLSASPPSGGNGKRAVRPPMARIQSVFITLQTACSI